MTHSVLCAQAQIEHPILCGAMYPCSNPELIAAVSEAGGMGIVQPLSMVFVHKHDFADGLKFIRARTQKPIGMNVIVEKSVKAYTERMERWVDIALEEGVRFFVTSLGNPSWVVKRAKAAGSFVYHDVVDKRWGQKALDMGVDGLICVNSRAGGHAGSQTPEALFDELKSLGAPLICAGGISTRTDYNQAMSLGYAGVQIGTRFIASEECHAHADYKNAIVKAKESDIVLTDKISGVPVAIIRTPYIDRVGTKAGPLARAMLRHPKLKHWMRTFYSVQSLWKLKEASLKGATYKDYWQAGKSVAGIDSILPAGQIVHELARIE